MKKLYPEIGRVSIAIMCLLCVIIVAISNPARAMASSDDDIVNIPDTNFQAIIRNATNCNLHNITVGDMKKLDKIENAGLSISDLSGIEYAINLKVLSLGSANIKDLTPLKNLSNLQKLTLKNNQISDISPLAGLTGLQELNLNNNQISNIKALNGLTNLTRLDLEGNQITDISPLADLINLQHLSICDNQVTNINPLGSLCSTASFSISTSLDISENNINMGGESESAVIKALLAKKIMLAYETQKRIQVKINDAYLNMDVPPVIINGRTMVPMRAILESLGATVSYDGKTSTVTAKAGTTTVIMSINNIYAKVDGTRVIMEAPPTVVQGRTMVPARIIAESLGKQVEWQANQNTVIIKDN